MKENSQKNISDNYFVIRNHKIYGIKHVMATESKKIKLLYFNRLPQDVSLLSMLTEKKLLKCISFMWFIY